VRGTIVIECWTEAKGAIVIAARDGAEVRAAQSGLVVFAGTFKSHGDVVLVKHADGVVSAVYGDIDALLVRARESVKKGQPLAVMRRPVDSAGAALRFELRRDGETIDARPFMNGAEPRGEAAAREPSVQNAAPIGRS
jgi:lipoprotein NlpD